MPVCIIVNYFLQVLLYNVYNISLLGLYSANISRQKADIQEQITFRLIHCNHLLNAPYQQEIPFLLVHYIHLIN